MATGLTGGGQGPITGPPILSGEGDPEGVYAAPVGTLYRRTDGTWDHTLYVKEDSSAGIDDKDGWTPMAAASPPGTIIDYAGTSAPTGWLLCFGQSVAVATYQALFNAIGYTYGGSGANFTIPDLRGRVLAGEENMGGELGGAFSGRLSNPRTGNTTNASAVITAITPNVGGIGRGNWITGTNIPVGTIVLTADSATQITLSANCTGTTTGVTFRTYNYDPVIKAGGSRTMPLHETEMAQHNHTFNDYYQYFGWVSAAGVAGGSNYNQSNNAASIANSTAYVGGNQYHNNVQPTILMNKLIKT